MQYDSEREIITVSCYELVATARRKMPSPARRNEHKKTAQSKLRAFASEYEEKEYKIPFTLNDLDFELVCTSLEAENDEILVLRRTSIKKGEPTSDVKKQSEGEGFITAYAAAVSKKLEAVKIKYVYVDTESGVSTERTDEVELARLLRFFEKCKGLFSAYSAPEIERVKVRLPSMKSLKFPYNNMREGQGELVRSVYRTVARGGSLFASAPTGTGKTVSVLYPAVRALGDIRVSKVFYLTPKTTTAEAAADCISLMCDNGAKIRAVIISAKERACRNGLLCRDSRELCENSGCKRISEAALALYNKNIRTVTLADIYEVSSEYKVCPYELELTYSELCDIIICDFNYLFEPDVYIRRYFDEGGEYAFLVDEAHNLPDRAREMYSAEIDTDDISVPLSSELIGPMSPLKQAADEAKNRFFEVMYPYVKEEIRKTEEGQEVGAQHLNEPPSELYGIFEGLLEVAESCLFDSVRSKDSERTARTRVIREYKMKLDSIYSALVRFDSSYELFVFYESGKIRIKVFCLDTGLAIADRLSRGKAAVFFSATLVPVEYYKAVLGNDRSSETIETRSPFEPSQLSVSVIDKISTRYSDRDTTLLSVLRVIACTASVRRGNYMVFCPSFAYAEMLYKAFSAKYPKIRTLLQKKDMTGEQRKEFLSEFHKADGSYLVAFSVMGGIYSEGVDFAGDSLIGAVVVGIGIPSISYEREAMSAYYEDRYEMGKQYAYIYPGMNRVLQAAGRVIRTESDRGVIVLIDDRFADPIYRKSVPALWRGMKYIPDAKTLKSELESFWKTVDGNK